MAELLECAVVSMDSEFTRNQFFTGLYERMFPAVVRFVRKQHGSMDDAKDIFHDALIVFYEKKVSGNLEIALTDEAYVFGIVKHLWIKKSKDNKHIL
jgi:DNA-directed RNA polymerase specialized sigma24 family protein